MSAVLDRLVAGLEPDLPDEVRVDAEGRVTEVADGDRCWRYRYDSRGDLVAVDDGVTGPTEYRYDTARRLTAVCRPHGQATSFRYDDRGRVVEVRDGTHRMGADFDEAGRVVALRHADELLSTYRYDTAGRFAEARSGGVVTRHVHDDAGRVIRVEQAVDGAVAAVALEHDERGRLCRVAPHGGPAVGYTWTAAGRIAAMSVDGRTVVDVTYDDEQRTTLTRLGNQVVEHTVADGLDGRPLARTVSLDGAVLLDRRYGYDAAGRVVEDGRRRFGYDAQSRLAVVHGADGTSWAFAYDAAGNAHRATYTGAGGAAQTDHLAFDGDRLLGVAGGPGGATQDARGSLTGLVADGASWAWRYDAAGRLVQVRAGARVVARLRYDHKGRLVVADWAAEPGGELARVVERYVYGPGDELLAVTDASGTPLRVPVRSPWAVHAEALAGAGGGRVRYLHSDERGTLWLATGEAGEVLARYDYDPFGAPLLDVPPQAPPPMFGGRRLVPGTGCYWFGARWYYPRLRRFLTRDAWTAGPDDQRLVHPAIPGWSQVPARAEQLAGWLRRPRLRDAYVFCANDPVNRLDPNGHWSFGAVVLSLLGAVWTLPNTIIGLALEISCLVGEVIRWLAWIVTAGRVSWQTPGFDVAASERLQAFGLVFRGGWLGTVGPLGITFGNVFFVDGEWESYPEPLRPGDILPTAYAGRVRLPRRQSLYEHELRHTQQYGWFGPFFLLGLPVFGVYEWDVILHGYRDAWLERDARAHSEGPDAPAEVVASGAAGAGGVTAPALSRQWVYWRAGGTTRVLWAGPDGVLHAPSVPGSTRPWEFTAPFAATPGDAVEVATSWGARPLPAALLATPGLLVAATVLPRPDGRARIDVPTRRTTLREPVELGLWPLPHDLPSDAYVTAGLPQAAALWTAPAGGNDGLTTAENAPAPDPGAARPGTRGLRVHGEVDAAATTVRVQLLDGSGQVIPLTPDVAGTPRTEATATLGAPSGARRPFTAELELADPAAAFGQVHLGVVAASPTGPVVEAFTGHLCGLQLALVDDPSARQPGPVPGEGDEVVVVDVDASPQDTPQRLADQARARRMVRYRIANETRPQPGGPPALRPRMPLWMGELQLVGVARAALEDVLHRRADRRGTSPGAPSGPSTTRISFAWRLRLSWDGPDSASAAFSAPFPRPNQRHSYAVDLPGTPSPVTAVISYDELGRITGPTGTLAPTDPGGELPGALQPAPQPAAFPVAGRRLPIVRVGPPRPWGRQAGAPSLPSLIVEFQPAVADASGEVIRGGDGVLTVDTLSLDGSQVGPGAPAGGTSAPPAGSPLLRLPPFRVCGLNPAPPQVEDVVATLVRQHVAKHAAAAHIAPLTADCWVETVLRILRHESGGRYHQFDERAAGRRRFQREAGTWWFGTENGMPLFGPPHGYGIGQLDLFGSPSHGATDDQVWSWFENLRAAVLVVLDEKAVAAWAEICQHVPTPLDQFTRAVFQRETVRRYNGGREFSWTGTTWAIQPSYSWLKASDPAKGPNLNLLYPNRVLGTGVVYFTNAAGAANQPDGASTQFAFPPPIGFQPAAYGPGTAP